MIATVIGVSIAWVVFWNFVSLATLVVRLLGPDGQ